MSLYGGRRGQRGQVLVLFAMLLMIIIAFAGLLIDSGVAWSTRRVAQGAADTAALAAAKTAAELGASGTAAQIAQAAQRVAAANGFSTTYTDCSGVSQTNGVVVNNPPLDGPNSVAKNPAGAIKFVEVIVTSPQSNAFSSIVGQGCWMLKARAVAEISTSAAASCSFCSTNISDGNHTVLLQNGSTLRVDGDIYVNSSNGGTGACNLDNKKQWMVCGDAFDIFGSPANPPAYISAKTISVVGGWETHDHNIVVADNALWPDYSTSPPTYKPCPNGSPDPPGYATLTPRPKSNVCIRVPVFLDPLNDPSKPNNRIVDPVRADYTVPTAANCPAGTANGRPSTNPANTTRLTITGNATLCPGIYYGGVSITGGTTTMLPGVYYMAGNGFAVSTPASLDGSAGVLIYNSSGGGTVNIIPDPDIFIHDHDIYPGRLNPAITIKSSKNPLNLAKDSKAQYTVHLTPVSTGSGMTAVVAPLNGRVEFYDGTTKISSPSSASCTTAVVSGLDKGKDYNCTMTYTTADQGTRGIAGVFFSSDLETCTASPCYNNAQAVLEPRQVIGQETPPGTVSIITTGTVKLSGITAGPYRGLVIFQDRSSDSSIILDPGGSGLGACGPNNIITVNGAKGPAWALQQSTPPVPCGALGGIEGTIYAPHSNSQVTIKASGIADLQLIAGKILITSAATARFSYDASKFAGGSIRLTE